MDTAGSHVDHRQVGVSRDPLFHAEIPLHYIIAMRVRLDVCGAQRAIAAFSNPYGSVGKRTLRKVSDGRESKVRCANEGKQLELIRQRKHIEYAETGTHHQIPTFQWRPGEPGARLEIPSGRVGKIRIAQVRKWILNVPQRG